MGRLEGKRALITGAGSGIGRAMAKLFAEQGATVVAADVKGHQETAAGNASIKPIECNVTDPAAVQAMIDFCRSEMGGLDVLCNNAGIGRGGTRVHEVKLEDWDAVFAVNVRGAFLVLKYALPLMIESGGGSVINTASTSAFKPAAGNGAYTPSKGAVLMLTKMAALEYAGDGIRINALCPGPIDTPAYDNVPAPMRGAILAACPLQRFGTAEEVANVALFLASDESSFVTGSAYLVDGGRLIG